MLKSAKLSGMTVLRLILPLLLLPAAALAQNRQDDFPRRVAVYVIGGISGDERTALSSYVLSSLINSGTCISHENYPALIAALIGEEQSMRQYAIDDKRISEIGRHFGIKYICIVSVTPAYGAYTVFARMLNTETERAKLSGDATGPLRTVEDYWRISNTVAEKMLGKRITGVQAAPDPSVVATTGGFKDADETARAGRNAAADLSDDDEAEPRIRGKTILAVSFDVLGVLGFAYGVFIENNSVKKNVKEYVGDDGRKHIPNGPEAEKAAMRRNIAYIVGGALLASGVSIHIFF